MEPFVNILKEGHVHPDLHCKVCGAPLYSTDLDNFEITYHCSSPAARFWEFDRGSVEERESKEHWDASRVELFFEQG
jgi:hypothetical protein